MVAAQRVAQAEEQADDQQHQHQPDGDGRDEQQKHEGRQRQGDDFLAVARGDDVVAVAVVEHAAEDAAHGARSVPESAVALLFLFGFLGLFLRLGGKAGVVLGHLALALQQYDGVQQIPVRRLQSGLGFLIADVGLLAQQFYHFIVGHIRFPLSVLPTHI